MTNFFSWVLPILPVSAIQVCAVVIKSEFSVSSALIYWNNLSLLLDAKDVPLLLYCLEIGKSFIAMYNCYLYLVTFIAM